MTRMRKNIRGFTLLEIVIVVGIIVILAGAASIGVAATINRANNAQNRLRENNGDNFENEARNEVKALTADPGWTPVESYTPDGELEDEDEDEGEVSPTPEAGGGGSSYESPKTVTNTPTPSPKPTNTPIPTPTKAPTTPSNGVSATVSGSQTNTPLGAGYQGSTKITGDGRGIRKITITAPEGVQIAQINDGSNSGLYTVTVSPDKASVTVTFTANWGPAPKSTVDLNYIQWVGSENLECTYEITY